jgi:L-alanine-DL-glutamate epimerase-like enolase superfamily enzyme
MLTGRGAITDGIYTLPTAPGWGVGFDEDFVKRHTVA